LLGKKSRSIERWINKKILTDLREFLAFLHLKGRYRLTDLSRKRMGVKKRLPADSKDSWPLTLWFSSLLTLPGRVKREEEEKKVPFMESRATTYYTFMEYLGHPLFKAVPKGNRRRFLICSSR